MNARETCNLLAENCVPRTERGKRKKCYLYVVTSTEACFVSRSCPCTILNKNRVFFFSRVHFR